jgi:uncharacterized protein YkwD
MFWTLFACTSKMHVPDIYQLPEEEVEEFEDLSTVVGPDSIDMELLEWAVFVETNNERERLGLSPFAFEPKLRKVAQLHSREMIELSYFEHVSPVEKNKTVKQRVARGGIRSGVAGENLAIHPMKRTQDIVFTIADPQEQSAKLKWRNKGSKYTYREFAAELVNRWMQSPPHRNNIVNRSFRYLGVGAEQTKIENTDVFYVTQNFTTLNY